MAGDDEIRIKITADGSEIKSEAEQSAAAVEKLGSAAEASGPNFERMQQGMVHVSAHMAGHMIPGMGRMATAIARMGEAAVGVGPLLAVMVPVAAIAAGVTIMEKLEEAHLKVIESDTKWTEASGKLNDKLMEEKEKLIGLTQGPLAEAIQKSKDFAESQSELATAVKAFDVRLDETTTKWAKYVQWVQHATDVTLHYASLGLTAPAAKGGMSDKELKGRVDLIEQQASKTKDYGKALQEIARLEREIAAAPGPASQEQIKSLSELAQRIKAEADVAAVHQKILNQEVAKQKTEADKKASDAAKLVRMAELNEMERAAKEQLKIDETIAKESAEFRKNIEEEKVKAVKELWISGNKEIDEQMRSLQKGTSLSAGMAAGAPGAKTATGGEQLADVYKKAADEIDPLMEKERALLVLAQSPEEIEAVRAKLQEMTDLQLQYRDKVIEINQQIAQRQMQVMQQITANLNTNLMSWMQGHERFGRAMEKTWMGIATAAISSMMKQVEMMIYGALVKDSVAEKQKLTDAKTAFHGAYAAVAGIPIIGPVLAPVAGATAAAAVMAFAQGGIMENDGGAILHKKEMVLPAHIAQYVQKAATRDVGGGEPSHQFNYSPTVQAIDRRGMEDALKEHGEMMFNMWRQQMRNRNI